MAITDNNFSADELEAVVTANPAVLEQITGYVTKKGGFFAPDGTKKTEYETNLKASHDSLLTSHIAKKNEEMVFKLTGIPKAKADQKWYDYAGEVLKTLSAADKAKAVELADLKSKTDLSAAERSRMTELETLSKTKSDEVETLKTQHQTELQKLKAENKIYQKIGSIDSRLKKTPELQEAIQIVREKVLNDMVGAAKEQNGKLVFLKPDGTFYTNPDASLMNEEQVYASRMDAYIDKAKTQGGAGGNGDSGDTTVVAGQFKSQVEGDAFLAKKGLISGTTEFTKLRKELGIDKLPLTA